MVAKTAGKLNRSILASVLVRDNNGCSGWLAAQHARNAARCASDQDHLLAELFDHFLSAFLESVVRHEVAEALDEF